MILAVLVSGFFSIISPSWGLFFTTLLGSKFYEKQKYVFLGLLSVATIMFFFLTQQMSSYYVLMEYFAGVMIPYYLLHYAYKRNHDIVEAINILLIFEILYSLIRNYLYGTILIENLQILINESQEMLEMNAFHASEQFFSILNETIEFMKLYQPAIWVSGIVLAGYLGFVLAFKKQAIKLNHQKIKFPFYVIYFMIIGLIGCLIKSSRVVSINLMLMLAPVFFIQGISILDFYWREHFKKSKWLLRLLIIMLLLNTYILILIIFMGLLDMWFDFRKLNIQEERDESHSH